MNTHRAVSVLLAVVAATMLVTGSFGFTSVSAERGVSVAVVESENAYVGVSACETSKGNGNGAEPAKVTVTNQFSDSFVVDEISWNESDHPNKGSTSPDKRLEPGESKTFSNTNGEGEVTVEVSDGLDATVTAPVDGQCGGNGAGTGNSTATANETDTETER